MRSEGVDRLPPALLAPLIERGDHWRGATRLGADESFHEWSHFAVFAPEVDVLVNWSRFVRPGRRAAAHLAVLARTEAGWEGDVERHAMRDVRLPGGSVEADVGSSRLRFRAGVYELSFELASQPVQGRLRLTPMARPALTSSVSLRPGQAMWFAIPRLVADGEVRVGERRILVRGAPAYHDRDWGHFSWGGDHAWEWSIALPSQRDCPWSLVVQRISDRRRHTFLSQGLLLWRNGRYSRTLHHDALDLRARGLFPTARALRVPRLMGLVAPGRATDAPEVFEVVAREGGDHIEGELRVRDVAQILVPNDSDLGTTVVTEARADARFEGRVRGERLRLEGPAVLELNRAAA